MKKLLITFLLSFATLFLQAQLVSLSPLDYEIKYKTEEVNRFNIDLYNPTQDSLMFNWTVDHNFDLSNDFTFFMSDFEWEFTPSVLTICDKSFVNVLQPNDTMDVAMTIFTKNISANVLASEPEINLYLQSYPNCDTNYLHYTFKIVDRSVNVAEESENFFLIYPNPAEDNITVDIPDIKSGKIIIHNYYGQLMYEKDIMNHRNSDNIDISDLCTGQYMISIVDTSNDNKKATYHNRFIKM